MKKLLTVLLAVVAVCCASVAVACGGGGGDDATHTHTWVATDETDENGNIVYVCDCGETHTHTFSASWTTDSTAHWHASTCGHSEAILGYEEHMFDDDGVCEVCGYEEAVASEYEILFAYYTDDNGDGSYDGNAAYDDDGNEVYDTYRGVTYTAVEYNGITVDIEGDYLQEGDKFAFTVKKSVYCVYTDSHNYPLVEVEYEDENGDIDSYTVEPDDDGVYVVTVYGNTVITVSNVEDMDITIDGKGTESNPYTINSVMDWLYFASIINNKTWYGISYNYAYWVLTCDLDFEGEEVYIVGDGYTSDYALFMGNFDGGGYTLSNLVITNAVYDSTGEYSTYVGLFGIVSGYAGVDTCIKNLYVEKCTIEAGASADSAVSVGVITGYLAGASIINCHVSDCTIAITADDDYSAFGGGIAGMTQSGYSESEGIIFYTSIQYCSADVDISGTGYIYEIGGITGRVVPYGSVSPVFIYNCYSSGVYTDSVRGGGITAYAGRYTSIQNCYSTAEITTASTQTTYLYADTMYDYRYSYAGGIVGFAENDTVIANCFYAGESLTATASEGTKYALTGDIIAAYSEAGYEDYRASAVLLINNIESSTTVTDSIIKNTLGWNDLDWVFSGNGLPVINTESSEYPFTITVVVGSETYSYTIESLYRPMAYWYLQAESDSSAIPEYLSSGNNRTYGYYFDSALTERVPLCYVPMDDITIYAAYVNYGEVTGTYMISSNGITATLTLEADGTYELNYSAIYLSGDYEYNGEYITMTDSYFSRFISSATSTQQETYFTFWAEINDNGDLEIYDCETLNEITETYDEYGYTYLARLVTKSNPLVAVLQSNTEVSGKYYDSTDSKILFTFEIGYTGTAYISDDTLTFTYYYSNGTLYVNMEDVIYTATIENGNVTALVNANSGATAYELVAYDDFEGTWEQSATIDKKYTFDGIGNWEYYVSGTLVSSGKYTVNSNGELVFARDSITVTVTINSDGTLNVKESTGSVGVTYYGEGGYQGTWYTAAISGNKYTLELSGIEGGGAGWLNLSGAGVSLSDMPYISDNGILYVYSGDTLYATLTYDGSTGTMTGLFYNSSTDSLSTSYLFYLYDDFYGEWFSDIEGLEKLRFNGLGAYDVAAADEDSMAVYGKVFINDSTKSIQYYINADGGYEFVYNGVTYIIAYDENNNEVTVSYNGTSAKLIAGDSLYGVRYSVNGETYEFNGGGNLTSGGTVTITDSDGNVKSATYMIDSDTGVITITYNGSIYATFTPTTDGEGEVNGYTVLIGSTFYGATVVNDFTGTWVIVGAYATVTIPEIDYYVSGTVIDLVVYYTSDSYNNVPIDACYDGSTMWIYLDSTTTYYICSVSGSLFMSDMYDSTDDDAEILDMVEYDGWLRTYENADGDAVALGGDSNYTFSYIIGTTKYTYTGYGNACITIDGEETDCLYKVEDNGDITLCVIEEVEDEDGNTVAEMTTIYTLSVSADGDFEYGDETRALVAASTGE